MEEEAETIEEVWGGGEGEKKIFSPTRESRCRASGRTLAEKFGELLWIELRKRFCERRGGKWLPGGGSQGSVSRGYRCSVGAACACSLCPSRLRW